MSFWQGNCFKYGSTLCFRMANSAIDVKGTFHNDTFPTRALLDAKEVAKVLGPENNENFKDSPFFKMCQTKDQETEHTCMGVHPKFRVVAVSHFDEGSYEEFLKDQFPLELMQPMKVFTD